MSEWVQGRIVFQPLADHGLLCTFGNRIDATLGQRIARLTDALAESMPPGVIDLIPSYTTLLLLLDPAVADATAIGDHVARLWNQASTPDDGDDGGANRPEVVIPVHYGGDAGPDLASVARHTGLAPGEVAARHAAATYQVGAIGFAPGFAFLIGLPPELAVPRRLTPRTAVPGGSVGIGGAQTGIYSLSTPGGWSLIGRTALTLFDPERDPPSLLQTGDTVRFQPVTSPFVPPRSARVPDRLTPPQFLDTIEVLRPGLQDTVQDPGRPGHGRLGVAPGGAADRAALVAGNRLLGNADDAAGLELTRQGPHLRFLRPARIVVTGADLGATFDGVPLPVGAVRVVRPGAELAFTGGRGSGARAYLGVAGGIDVPLRLGSRSTDLTARFGGHEGRPLQAGDRLRVGRPGNSPDRDDGWYPASIPADGGDRPFRVTPGPQAERFDARAWATFLGASFTVSAHANRMGLRLEGPALIPAGGADIISEGIVTGAIQVTGEGQPIVMLPARATIGGYPKIATVIAADLDRLGQLRPGDVVRFALAEGDAAKR